MKHETKTMLEEIEKELLNKEALYNVLIVNSDQVVSSFEVSTTINNIYEFDVSKFLPNSTAMSLDKFFELTSQIIKDAQVADGVTSDRQVKFTEEYPPEEFHNFGDEVIAFRVIRREPANMNQKGTGRPQRGFAYNYDLEKPNFPNKTIIVESRPVDHVIELTCWGKTNKIANRRALWLEKLLINNSWQYQVQGTERFHWEGRGADTYMTSGEQRLFYRPLRFFVRFREFEAKLHSLIKNIEIIHGGINNG